MGPDIGFYGARRLLSGLLRPFTGSFNRWAPRGQHPTLSIRPALGKHRISFVLATAGFLQSAVMAVLGAFGLRATAVLGASGLNLLNLKSRNSRMGQVPQEGTSSAVRSLAGASARTQGGPWLKQGCPVTHLKARALCLVGLAFRRRPRQKNTINTKLRLKPCITHTSKEYTIIPIV